MIKFSCFAATVLSVALPLAPVHGADAPPPVVIESAPEPDQSKLQQENAALRAENQRLSGELHDVQWALAEAKTRIDELTAASKPVEAPDTGKFAAEKARADEATARLNTLVTGVETLTNEKSTLEARVAALTKSEGELKEQLAAAKAAAVPTDATTKLAESEAKLAEANRRITNLQAENQLLNTTSADHARLNAEVQTLRQAKASLEARVAQSQNTTTPAADDATDLTNRLAQSEAKLATALRSYASLQNETEKVKAAAAAQSRQTAELETLRKEKAALESRLAQGSQSPAAATPSPDAAELSNRLAQTESKLETALHSYAALQSETEKLKSASAASSQQSAELETLRHEKAALEARVAANPADDSHALASRLAAAEDKLSTALHSYSLLQRENDQLKAESGRAAEAAHSSAAKSANDSANQASSLFDELRQTQAQVTSLSAENAQLKTRLALVGSPPGSSLSSPSRPGSPQALAASTPAPATETPAAAPAPRTHVVVSGDTLGKLSRQYYGSPSRWEDILKANRDVIKNENVLTVGTTLKIP